MNGKPFRASPSPAVAGILAGFFPFGVGAVYTRQYTKGLAHLLIFVGLNFGMLQRFPLRLICLFVYIFYYVWQVVDTVRTANSLRSVGEIPDTSTMKRAVFVAAVALMMLVNIPLVVVGDSFIRRGKSTFAERILVETGLQPPAPQAAAQIAPAAQEHGETCVNGAKECAVQAMLEWDERETGETEHKVNYSCPDPETQTVLKISLVRGSKLDVANLYNYEYGQRPALWGALVYHDKKYEPSDGSYLLQGERQFAAQNADIKLSLTPVGSGVRFAIVAVKSGHAQDDFRPEDIMFEFEGSCTRVADRTANFSLEP